MFAHSKLYNTCYQKKRKRTKKKNFGCISWWII